MLTLCLAMLEAQEEIDKFEELYHKYRKIIKYIATDYMGDDVLAEDATQEAFLKLTKYIGKIESIDSPKTLSFVSIVTKSVCLDMLRSEKAYRKTKESVHTKQADNTEIVNILLDKIKSLPEIYRDALMLKYYFDMPNKQIGDICHISEETVRKRLQRAKQLINEVKI